MWALLKLCNCGTSGRKIINYVHEEYPVIPISIPDMVWAAGPRSGDWRPPPSPFYMNYVSFKPAE